MIEDIKLMLGERASNYTDALISLCYRQALIEVESYCRRKADAELELVAQQIAIIKLNKQGAEGLTNQSFSGVSEAYTDGYPAELQAILDRKRKLKVV